MDPTAPAPEPRPARPRWVKAAVAAFVAFELTAAALLVGRDPSGDAAKTPPRPAPTVRPSAGSDRQDSPDRSATLRNAAVQDLLATRARAIRRRDAALFASTLDPFRPAFAKRQRAMFANLADVPMTTWRYDLDAGDVAANPGGYAGETWAPRVTLRYALRGYDGTPAAVEQYFTFVRRGDRWLVASDTDFTKQGRRTGRELWDFGPVTVTRGAHSLVLGHPGYATLQRDAARHADEAVPRVSKVWGTRWPQRVVVVVPKDQDEAGAILGDDGDLSRIAAVSVAGLPDGADGAPVGNRVVLNPPNYARLGPTGRRIVLTHEVTHVATRDAGAVGVPTWVVEGFADYVGYLGTGLSARLICQELAVDVRAGRAPRTLPADDDFDGGNARLAQAYESAWLANHLVTELAGERGLVTFYRRVAGGEPVARVLHEVTGLTATAFTAEWRRYVRRTLG